MLDTSDAKNRILSPNDTDGNELDLVLVGEAKLGVSQQPELYIWQAFPQHGPVDFADFVTLRSTTFPDYQSSISAGSELEIGLHWIANGTPSKDYTVFVQLIDPDGNQISGADAPPLNGDYPTRLWEAGEWIDETKRLPIPADAEPGTYKILIGMYDPLTGERMQRLDGGDSVEAEIEIRP